MLPETLGRRVYLVLAYAYDLLKRNSDGSHVKSRQQSIKIECRDMKTHSLSQIGTGLVTCPSNPATRMLSGYV